MDKRYFPKLINVEYGFPLSSSSTAVAEAEETAAAVAVTAVAVAATMAPTDEHHPL